jgi:hypothetical protein
MQSVGTPETVKNLNLKALIGYVKFVGPETTYIMLRKETR